MADIGTVAGAFAGIFQMLPQILALASAIAYAVAVLFFGSLALKGFRGFLPWPKMLLLRVALGIVCVATGIAVTPFLGINNAFLKMMQIDILAGMVVSTAVVFTAMKLMTLNVPYSMVLKDRIKFLEKKLEKRKDKDRKMPENRLKSPATIAGLAVFIGFIGFAMLNFHGVPDMKSSLLSGLGLSDADLAKMSDVMGQYASSPYASLSPACLSSLQEMQGSPEAINSAAQYTSAALRSEIESKSGGTVNEMRRAESSGKTLVIASLADGRQCFATGAEFCVCSGAD